MRDAPLHDDLVVDLSTGVPGGYCSKVLVDAGATVVKVEPPQGDAMRRWSASGQELRAGEDAVLFRYLAAGKQSLVLDPADGSALDRLQPLLAAARVIVWSPGPVVDAMLALHPEALRAVAPAGVIVAITPHGLTGPWRNDASTEFTLQGASGAAGARGARDRPPVSVGGDIGEWLTGMIAATTALTARSRALETGVGELVDISMLETMVYTLTIMPITFRDMLGRPITDTRVQFFPGIQATSNGYIALQMATTAQWLDLCRLVDRPDWAEDPVLLEFDQRSQAAERLKPHLQRYFGALTTAEALERAAQLRIPCAPVVNGETIPEVDQFRATSMLAEHPDGFVQPACWWHSNTFSPLPLRRAPRLGASSGQQWTPLPTAPRAEEAAHPFGQLRVLDLTQFWAGPIVSHLLSMFGADVIHVEGTERMDSVRYMGPASDEDQWWERAPWFHASNTNKRSLAIDLRSESGREVVTRLISTCDVIIENWSPRVFERLLGSVESLQALNPGLIVVRMPCYGLAGPWRDWGGYTNQLEAATGLVWMTGYPDRDPDVPQAPCDPIAGSHAAIALMLALEHRRQTGEGSLIETPAVAAGLNLTAEQVIEYTAYGALLRRDGNRGPRAAPQGMYLSGDVDNDGLQDRWIAIAVASDAQWDGLRSVVGPALDAPDLRSVRERRRRHDEIDAAIGDWSSRLASGEAVARLRAAGVPAAKVLMPHEQVDNEQLVARGWIEEIEHPVAGPVKLGGYPARFEHGPSRWHQRPAPLLGQDNLAILEELGYDDDAIGRLRDEGVIGDRPHGVDEQTAARPA